MKTENVYFSNFQDNSINFSCTLLGMGLEYTSCDTLNYGYNFTTKGKFWRIQLARAILNGGLANSVNLASMIIN